MLKDTPYSIEHYIDGQWIKGKGHPFQSLSPINNSIISDGFFATNEEVNHAFSAAKEAFYTWRELSLETRISYLNRFQEIVKSKTDALTTLIAIETGKPLWEAKTEAQSVINKVAISIQAYHERTSEKSYSLNDATGHLQYKPHGVVAVLGPFNFPAHLSNGHIVPALLAGNTVVYKPSELTPCVAAFMVKCWHESGLPKGVLNLIHGDAKSAQSLIDLKINGVYFTGSYQAGLAINKQLSERPEVIIALEMGGNNSLIIGKTENMEAAVYHSILSTMITAGQRCTCARRLFIPNTHEGDRFLTHFTKACQTIKIGAFDEQPQPFMGPVISEQHALNHLKAQANLKSLGGESIVPMQLMKENSGFLSPGIMEMTQVSHAPDEEIFAPFVQVYRYSDFEEAIDKANQTNYGLAAGLISDDKEQFQRFSKRIDVGIMNWNRATTGALSNMPFGGIGFSGNHRPSAYFAADYCAYPVAGVEQSEATLPKEQLPGIQL